MTTPTPNKRFAISTTISDEELLELVDLMGDEQAIKQRVYGGLLKDAQTILPQYPGCIIDDPQFEVDRDLMHQWTVVTLTFRLTPGA